MLVAITGVTASGKSTLSNELCQELQRTGHNAIRSSIDNFHNPSSIRHASKKPSWQAYYEDAHDYTAMVERFLAPLSKGGNNNYQNGSLDLENDVAINPQPQTASNNSIFIVDGSFLLKPQLNGFWHYRIFVKTDFDVARGRGVARDSSALGGPEQTEQKFIERYHKASQHYLETVQPGSQANAIVVNNDLLEPELIFPAANT